MANKRNDPVLREIERRKDRERRALARQKAGVREKERKRDKLYKKLLRDRAKNAGVVEDDTLRGISDSTNMVIVYSGTCPVKTRVESESLSALNSLQQITVRDIICETASTSTRKGNEDHCVDEVKNCTETTISNSSPVLIDSNRTFESDSLADMELSESDTMRICNNGDVRTSNHGDSGETVRIINSESGEEVVLCTGDAIDEKTAMFIKNVILKTETVHSV